MKRKGTKGKWAGVSSEVKKKREEGAKKRKAIKKKTDSMKVKKVGATRSKLARKFKEYSEKYKNN